MKKCPKCNFIFDAPVFHCPKCKFTPALENGIQVFSLEIAKNSDYMPSDHYITLMKLEDKGYWWFKSRSNLICTLFKKYFPKAKSFCEAGCGGGYLLKIISNANPDLLCYGTEVHLKGLLIAQIRLSKATLFQSDLLQFPFKEEFDVIGVFDVIEHIEEDVLALKCIYDAVKFGGGVIISVPHHKWLYGKKDEYSGHKRRYTRKELINKVEEAGFKVLRSTSFTSLLFPLFCLSRIMEKDKPVTEESLFREFKISSLTNKIFNWIMKIELVLTKLGINFPFGGSLFIVGEKTIDNKAD